MKVWERIESLRKRMREEDIDVYYIPTNDFHGSEYVSGYFQTREYISGFTGSAGVVIVTLEDAGLWTDGRYFIQAEKQLQDSGITLYRMGLDGVPTVNTYLDNVLKDGQVLGCDGRMVTTTWLMAMKRRYKVKSNVDLVGDIWEDRPDRPKQPIWELAIKYAGVSREEKLSRLWDWMKQKSLDYFILTSLDDIAWLFNLRGNDIPCCPVFLSYAVFTQESGVLFCEKNCANGSIQTALMKAGIETRPYEEVEQYIRKMGQGKRVAMDMRVVNAHLAAQVPNENTLVDVVNPTGMWKAVKNETEVKNERIAHLKDGIAITKMLYWLRHTDKKQESEISVSDKLEEFRRLDEDYLGPSFDTISGYAEHGAIVHYSATPETNHMLDEENFLLLDMGGHYYQGTTDITRTVMLGTEATDEQKKYYTTVLRGNLALGAAKFHSGITGVNLDVLARQPLWEIGCDFLHGTGHGVGYLLNVHEGPNAIRYVASKQPGGDPALEPGMITSNEPGVYLENKFGIRLENLILCCEAEYTDFGRFLEFETLTLVPFDRRAIDVKGLSDKELGLLNAYHQRVYEEIGPHLTPEERDWLQEECSPIL